MCIECGQHRGMGTQVLARCSWPKRGQEALCSAQGVEPGRVPSLFT
jgi:hypothetical protein